MKKITDPMAIMIRVDKLMAGCFWFFWEFVGFLYFLKTVPLAWSGGFERSFQLIIVRLDMYF